jgi:hypothetical protein
MPWDDLLTDSIGGPSKPSIASRPEGGITSAKALLTSSAIDIKQKVTLSPEQQMVLSMVLQGKNVFFTGSAGKLRARAVWRKGAARMVLTLSFDCRDWKVGLIA